MAFILCVLNGGFFIFSNFGQSLLQEVNKLIRKQTFKQDKPFKSSSIATEIANLPWYNIKSLNEQKYICMIILRSQREIGVQASPLAFMTYDSYSEAMKLVFNYFTAFHTMLSE